MPISAIVSSLGPGAPSDWQSPQPVEKAATLVDGYDISTSIWENEMGREIRGSDASKTRPSFSAPEPDLSAQNLF